MTAKYVFVTNVMYNSETIRPVRWWHLFTGFPGEVVVETFHTGDKRHTVWNRQRAVAFFAEKHGLHEQTMGVRK